MQPVPNFGEHVNFVNDYQGELLEPVLLDEGIDNDAALLNGGDADECAGRQRNSPF